jgi:16S rRNA (cytosine967-C5)-methyltransferase
MVSGPAMGKKRSGSPAAESKGSSREGRAPPRTDAQPKGAIDPRLGRTHDRILDAYGIIATGIPADVALKTTFKRARDLGSSERAEVSETIWALVRSERRIDDLLRRAAKAEKKSLETIDPPILARMRILALLAMNGASLEALEGRDRYAFRRIPRLFERIRSGRISPARRSALEEIAVTLSYPSWLIERLAARFGAARAEEIAIALNGRAPMTVRVNTLVSGREEAAKAITEELCVRAAPTAISPLGLILEGHPDVQRSKLFDRGQVEVQDEGSQLIALATKASPREIVLDGCAGAGGKTLALAAMMENTGRLVAIDPDEKKLETLKERARRAGITNMEAVAADLEALDPKFKGAFERVLLDAPCTGTGAIRRQPDARWRITPADLARHVERQRRLVTGAVSALRPRGLLVYATCSVLWEENEQIIDETLAHEPRLEPVPLREMLGDDIAGRLHAAGYAIRIGPGPTDRDPDGFFLATLRKR